MSEDWIPVPEIDNVLIVLAELAETPEDIAEAPVMELLTRLLEWHGGSVYVFHAPPEAGEVLEDVSPEIAARFALAAQMTDNQAEVCRDAFRRVFSRASVKRAVIIHDNEGSLQSEVIDALFAQLENKDIIWAGEWGSRFAFGMQCYHPEIFSDVEAGDKDLRNIVQAFCTANNLNLGIVPKF